MSSPKGDPEIELYFVALVVLLAMCAALLAMWIYCN